MLNLFQHPPRFSGPPFSEEGWILKQVQDNRGECRGIAPRSNGISIDHIQGQSVLVLQAGRERLDPIGDPPDIFRACRVATE
jgi:hypothetical protein